ncbi:hypothetical protein BGZ61DRAFT_371347 [Ilyonectria robusta]|uniref:uncharacterized protein n=1 Tax=Ilyonectria robusta TaxID=1079257 RepID=UPI001E8CA637|nr:uncharacterized protein BGZ61DRAFT_371347 [Ilyonectria robusta]KAH8657354.1 hypothetical protein BGZ61DRAFT_371347 [Ilyonectria robusta]
MASTNVDQQSGRNSVHEERADNGENAPGSQIGSDNAPSDDHVRDKEAAAVPTKNQKITQHFARFKWWYLLGLIILLAILLPIFFKVIIPVIIQNILNGQSLPINGGALQILSPTHLNMSLATSLNTPLGVKIKPVDLYLFNKNTKPFSSFFKLHLPTLHIHHRTDVIVTNQTVLVTNETELITWFNQFFDQPKVKLSLQGHPEVRLSSLAYKPDFDKTIEIPSLNYLDGFGVNTLNFNLQSNETVYNMKGFLNIPNSGVLTLGLGNMTYNLMSGKTRLGLVNIYDVQLKPGNNSVPFDGQFFFQELVPNLASILDSQKEALGQGNIEFNATGNATTYNGEHIKYIEDVLNRKHIKFTIPVITILSDVVGGLLGAGGSNLLELVGGAIGNSTLFENLLDHWEDDGQGGSGSSTKSKTKRARTGRSLMWNALRLGFRMKTK